MKLDFLVGAYLVAQAAAAPMVIPTYFKRTPYPTSSTVEFEKRA
jgi:hypothetical protein